MDTQKMGLIKVDRTLLMQLKLQEQKKKEAEAKKLIEEREKQQSIGVRPLWRRDWSK
jgi:hypothetical protein